MSQVMDRIRLAALRAAKGPLADARERPLFDRVPAGSPFPAEAGPEEWLARFKAELEALTARVYGPFDEEAVAAQVAEIVLAKKSPTPNPQPPTPIKVLSWSEAEIGVPGLARQLREEGIEMVVGGVPNDDGHQKALEEMAGLEVGITGAIAALAETGSLVVASGPGRARIASLLPPVHIAVVGLQRLYPTMHEWLSVGGAELARRTANLVVITGSSRTSDIELQLTLGMHGPKELHVVLYGDKPKAPTIYGEGP